MKKRLTVLVLLIVFISSCSVRRGYSKAEYRTVRTNLATQRPYPVLRDSSAVPILIDALDEDSPLIRFNAAHDLKGQGENARSALSTLIDCYKDVDFKVAQMCYVASTKVLGDPYICLLYTSPSPRDATLSRMPSSA